MKALTKVSVQTIMDLLIHTNGQTSTLEVKNELRNIGYFAEQVAVHQLMCEIFEDDATSGDTPKFERSLTGVGYNIYKYTQEFLDENSSYTTPTVDTTQKSGLDIVQSIFGQKQTTLPASIPTTPAPIVSRDPKLIFYTTNHAAKSNTDPEDWIVYHADGNHEIQIFDKSMTRDLVRSRYTSILKVKIQDVRSCRFKNYKA